MMSPVLCLVAVLLASGPLAAADEKQYGGAMPETSAAKAVLIDVNSNTILLDKHARERMPTSSMSKMLTIYLVFEALKADKLKLTDTVKISERAWRMQGSRMFVDLNSEVKVEDLIRGVIVQSGNDASVALAEAVAGTEEIFAKRMNETAARLGMTDSHFTNATGMPDPDHYSTALDLARLGIALRRDFPEFYHYYSETEFTYNGIKQGNRNPLLYRKIGADGIKTGHTEAAGFGLAASAERDGRRLVLVVNGLKSMQERADEPARLIAMGYHDFKAYPLFRADQPVVAPKVWLGASETVPLVPGEDITITLPIAARDKLRVRVEHPSKLIAPVTKGQIVGKIIIQAPDMPEIEHPLRTGADVPKLGFFDALMVKLHNLFTGAAA